MGSPIGENFEPKILQPLQEASNSTPNLKKSYVRPLPLHILLIFTTLCLSCAYVEYFFERDTSEIDPFWSAVEQPDIYLCPSYPYLADTNPKRSPRFADPHLAESQELKRILRPLSLSPPSPLDKNYTQEPPLYHDQAARCFWKGVKNRKIQGIDAEAFSYDFQFLDLTNCSEPNQCKQICLKTHKLNDPDLCNYVVFDRRDKQASLYYVDPSLAWNHTLDPNVETFEWHCRALPLCDWFWRRQQILSHVKFGKEDDHFLLESRCKDFGACQRLCESHPRCNYIISPSNGIRSGPSYLYFLPDELFLAENFSVNEKFDSFEISCRKEQPKNAIVTTIKTFDFNVTKNQANLSTPEEFSNLFDKTTPTPAIKSTRRRKLRILPPAQPAVPIEKRARRTQNRQKRSKIDFNVVERTSVSCFHNNDTLDCSQISEFVHNYDKSTCLKIIGNAVIKNNKNTGVKAQIRVENFSKVLKGAQYLWLSVRRPPSDDFWYPVEHQVDHLLSNMSESNNVEIILSHLHDKKSLCHHNCFNFLSLKLCSCHDSESFFVSPTRCRATLPFANCVASEFFDKMLHNCVQKCSIINPIHRRSRNRDYKISVKNHFNRLPTDGDQLSIEITSFKYSPNGSGPTSKFFLASVALVSFVILISAVFYAYFPV